MIISNYETFFLVLVEEANSATLGPAEGQQATDGDEGEAQGR